MLDTKKIRKREVEYDINVDQLPGIPEVIAEYLMCHAVTVLLEGRYQVDGGNPDAGDQPAWRLLDWKILTVSLDGQVHDHDGTRSSSTAPTRAIPGSTLRRDRRRCTSEIPIRLLRH